MIDNKKTILCEGYPSVVSLHASKLLNKIDGDLLYSKRLRDYKKFKLLTIILLKED